MAIRLSFAFLAILSSLFAMTAGAISSDSPRAPVTLKALLDDHPGDVLILLLGTDGCSATANATMALEKYLSSKPVGVSVVRVDVPLPGEKYKLKEWKHSFPRFIDDKRQIADKLEFFFYPTLYILDSGGEKRYVGACKIDQVAAMVDEIRSEKPGDAKKMFTPLMPAVGSHAPDFSGTTLSKTAVSRKSLTKKRGLMVIFGRTSCPFSAADIPQFKELASRFSKDGVGVVVVNQREGIGTIKPIYSKNCSGVSVIWDQDGKISKLYGVDAVPYFFLLDGNGMVVDHQPFTHSDAVSCTDKMLGLKSEKQLSKPTKGG